MRRIRTCMISTWVKNNIFATITMFLKQWDFNSEVQQLASLQHFAISLHLSQSNCAFLRMVQFFQSKLPFFYFKKISSKKKTNSFVFNLPVVVFLHIVMKFWPNTLSQYYYMSFSNYSSSLFFQFFLFRYVWGSSNRATTWHERTHLQCGIWNKGPTFSRRKTTMRKDHWICSPNQRAFSWFWSRDGYCAFQTTDRFATTSLYMYTILM